MRKNNTSAEKKRKNTGRKKNLLGLGRGEDGWRQVSVRDLVRNIEEKAPRSNKFENQKKRGGQNPPNYKNSRSSEMDWKGLNNEADGRDLGPVGAQEPDGDEDETEIDLGEASVGLFDCRKKCWGGKIHKEGDPSYKARIEDDVWGTKCLPWAL